MEKKATSEHKNNSSKKLVRSVATCGDDDNVGLKPRLVNSQTKPALSNSVSKDSSTEFTDATLTDLHSFIVQTLHKNSKDRNLILNAEHELVALMQDGAHQSVSFTPMSSYERMIVHRVAAYFGFDHNVSQDGTYVICSKTDVAKLPPIAFTDLIQNDEFTEPIKPISGQRSSLPRSRRRSQNTDNLSCAMSALNFVGEGRENYKNYSVRSNEQTTPPYYWMPSTNPYGYQNQNYGYYPTNQINTSASNYVSMHYPNMSPQPNQSYNYYPSQMAPQPSYYYNYQQGQNMFRPDYSQSPNNVQTSP
ncbi:R3H domain-containing protein [Aphelenchoides bicaudatus]|nr:R3H domain-containing protein [Aphelenchoides bicaudatus]